MKKILKILLCIYVLLSVVGCGTTKKEEKSNFNFKINKYDGITIDSINTNNNEIIFDIKNEKNNSIENANANIAIFDKNGDLIKTEKQYIKDISINREYIFKISLANEENKEVSKVEVTITKNNYNNSNEKKYNDKVSGTVKKIENNSNQLEVIFTNTSGVNVGIVEATVLYLKNSKIVNVSSLVLQNLAETKIEKVYVPTIKNDDKYQVIDYDEAKVIINTAYSYEK